MQYLLIHGDNIADPAAISYVIEHAVKDQQYSSHTEPLIVNVLR
ncbi:hypothetical protein [Acinetobacter sp.]